MKLRHLRVAVLLLLLPFGIRPAAAYTLLTHEQLIDLTWQTSIVPLLLSRYPSLTPEQLEQARAYAYGGCVIQDIGYYPFGDLMFSDLTHYVRSGDFVVNLFRDAHNADELAFAIGALSHYVGDTRGHSEATNVSVPVEFPKLRAQYGPVVSYAEGKHQHVQVEFAFDIDEVAQHHLAPLQYLRHVGLGVPAEQLSLAYYQTYGLRENFSGLRHRHINASGYRFSVRVFIPRIAYAVTLLRRRHEPAEINTPERVELEREVAAMAAQNHWDAYRRKAGIGTYMLAGLIFVIPKIGPLQMVNVKGPTERTEAEYTHSVTVSVAELRRALARFTPPSALHSAAGRSDASSSTAPFEPTSAKPSPSAGVAQLASDPRHPLPNLDLDTGYVVKPGGYPLTDSTLAALLHRLTRHPAQPIPPGIKRDIQAYYANPDAPISTRKNPEKWARVQADLQTLANMPTSAEPQPFTTYSDGVSAAQ